MKRIGFLALAGLAIMSLAFADGTGSNKGLKRSSKGKTVATAANTAETGLIGVKLYDTGIDIVNKFGSPDEIQDVATGAGGAIGPAGAGGGAAGGRGGGGGNRGGGGASAAADWMTPELDWNPINVQGPPSIGGTGGSGVTTPQGGGGGAQGGGGGRAGGGGAAGADARVVYTRWVYRRGNSRYAFVLNRYNQVIQIEAIGSNDPKVATSRGVRYGTQFAEIIKKYGAPDGYEINGNTLVLRYLVKNKVAFRMNRLQTDGKHVVTGVVVAAGKM